VKNTCILGEVENTYVIGEVENTYYLERYLNLRWLSGELKKTGHSLSILDEPVKIFMHSIFYPSSIILYNLS